MASGRSSRSRTRDRASVRTRRSTSSSASTAWTPRGHGVRKVSPAARASGCRSSPGLPRRTEGGRRSTARQAMARPSASASLVRRPCRNPACGRRRGTQAVVAAESTLDGVRETEQNRRGVVGRSIALVVFAIVVVVGATGWLGVHAQTKTSSSIGYTMTVTYPRVARSGLDIPWNLRLSHPGGFQGDITVAISADYFDIFEFQGFHPEPSDETADADFVYLTFAPPAEGDVFTMSWDTYVQPSSQVGRDATVKVIVAGVTVASANYSTTLLP